MNFCLPEYIISKKFIYIYFATDNENLRKQLVEYEKESSSVISKSVLLSSNNFIEK